MFGINSYFIASCAVVLIALFISIWLTSGMRTAAVTKRQIFAEGLVLRMRRLFKRDGVVTFVFFLILMNVLALVTRSKGVLHGEGSFFRGILFALRGFPQGEGADIGEELTHLITKEKSMIHLPFANGAWDINESIVVSWIVVAAWLVICLFLTSGMKTKNIGKRQVIAETIVVSLRNLLGGILGENGKRYTDWLLSILLFLGLANLVGIFGLEPPTFDLNITIALALMSILLIEVSGIVARGMGGWLKAFTHPIALVTPFNILEIGIRPLSLCMRLFGNILGATVIMELLKLVVPVGIPAIFALYFDLFDGLIQAYIFVFLTSLFIAEATETEE